MGTERGRLLEAVPRESIERDFALVPALRELNDGAPRQRAVVHRYYYDMGNAFDMIKGALDDNACMVIVCGDNLIGGVRICTWRALQTILEEKGFRLVDRFSDRIRDRLLPPARLGHRGLIKEEVISAYRLGPARGEQKGSPPQKASLPGTASSSLTGSLG